MGLSGAFPLPRGGLVRGRGLREPCPDEPAFGLYLGTAWLRRRRGGSVTWPHEWLRWQDFGVPADPHTARSAIRDLHARITRGEDVEVACGGGTGRTGTVIACLAVLDGVDARDAVAWTRAHYRPRAVETRGQRRWVAAFTSR